MDVGVIRTDGVAAARLAAISRGALDRALGHDAELLVAVPADEGDVIGAFERGRGDGSLRRGSGGGPAHVGPGTVWVQLALARPDALVACDADKLLNRYVRPLLKALTKSGALAHYFGRDWVSVAHRPAALLAFAHDAGTGRAMVEAIVGVTTPFASGDRASFLGKAPTTIGEHARATLDASKVADAIVQSYLDAYGRTPKAIALPSGPEEEEHVEPPWTATREEAIGTIGAGRDRAGRLRVGGELMASRDAVKRLEEALARGDDPSAAVDAAIGAPGVVTFGVRSLASIRDAIADALTAAV